MATVGGAGGALELRSHARPATWAHAPQAPGPRVVPHGTLPAYRVVYRVDAGVPLGSTVTTETVAVLRPWGSRVTTRSGSPPGGAVVDDLTSDFARLRTAPPTGATTVLETPPDLAASDLRLDVAADDLVAAGLGRWADRRLVLGQPCQVLVTTTPPQGEALDVLGSGGDQVWSCVDGDGLILEQLRLSNGKVLLRQTAVSVDRAPVLDPATFAVNGASTVPVSNGGGSVVAVPASTLPPGPSWTLASPPPGFAPKGHYAVAEASSADPVTGQPTANRRGGFSDVWVRGPDVLILDQGGTLYGAPAFTTLPGSRVVDLSGAGLGSAMVVPGARLSQVVAVQSGGRYVRLAGTLPVDQLVTLAQTLKRVDAPTGG